MTKEEIAEAIASTIDVDKGWEPSTSYRADADGDLVTVIGLTDDGYGTFEAKLKVLDITVTDL